MENEQKDKLKKGAKIVGSATWSAFKGALKVGKAVGLANASLSNGGSSYSVDMQMRDAKKGEVDFKNAWNKLKRLKNLSSDTEIPEDIKETSAEFYDRVYDEALDNPQSQEHWHAYVNPDGTYKTP